METGFTEEWHGQRSSKGRREGREILLPQALPTFLFTLPWRSTFEIISVWLRPHPSPAPETVVFNRDVAGKLELSVITYRQRVLNKSLLCPPLGFVSRL